MTSMKTCIVIALLLALGACKVGPNYQRPPLTVPDQYRGLAPDANTQQPAATPPATETTTPPAAAPQSQVPAPSGLTQPPPAATPPPPGTDFAQMQYWAVFQDETLQALIKEALANNYNIRIAASRILQASANVGITRANQFPQVNAGGSVINQRDMLTPGAPTFDTLSISMSYIVDFWGQYRRATESARATLLATKYAQNVVQTTLVSSVASNYFQLRQFDAQLDYSQRTVDADKEILKLNNIKFKGGESAITDVYQAETLVQQAEAQVINFRQLVEQTENNLSILLGRNPGSIARGLPLTEQPHLPDVPAGLPSALLQRRPDVLQAESNLVAANANVGVAKALFFPQISLTGTFGAQSTAITSFLEGPATFWSVGGGVVQPVFQGGRIRANYRLAWAQRDQFELQYKQTVQQAFADVANSLVGYNQSRQFRMKIEEQTQTYHEMARLANVRFQGGQTSFLEVQYYEQQYFISALSLEQAWFSELENYVQLYQALGGGWQQ